MKCFLDGAVLDPVNLTYREIGGEDVPERFRRELRIEIPTTEFVELLSERYATLVTELRLDGQLTGDDAEPFEQAMLDNPALERFLDVAPQYLASAMQTYLWSDFVQAGLGSNPQDGLRYVADQLQNVSMRNGLVTLTAVAFPIRPFTTTAGDGHA